MDWQELGKLWVNGYKIEEIDLGGKHIVFNPTQNAFINDLKSDYCLSYGGFGSGKSFALYIKMILFCLCFPKNTVLFGRKAISDITKANKQDFSDLLEGINYRERIKDGIIEFSNGSKIIIFGLDAMQSGTEGDIKKAEQKIRSMNLSAYFIDQLEEVEYSVFDALSSRLRNLAMPFQQGNSTSNVANYWAFHYFIRKCNRSGEDWVERTNEDIRVAVYRSATSDNKEHLPESYIRTRLAGHDQKWIDRYYEGIWTADVLSHRQVFSGYTLKWTPRPPMAVENACEIYEQPRPETIYQMGIDPSEGVIDSASISIVSSEGKKVAKFNGKIPINGLSDKVKTLYYKYRKPKVILEVNDKAGGALLENIKDLNIYRRQVFEYKETESTEKLGFKTNHQTKRMLIDNFQQLMQVGFPKIFDARTIDEFQQFVWSDDAKHQGAAAQKGFHDDDVMSTLLAFWEFTPKRVDHWLANEKKPIKKKKFQYR